MMDEAIKTHKETSFGWVLMMQEVLHRAAVRRAAAQARARALAAETRAKPLRYLTPR